MHRSNNIIAMCPTQSIFIAIGRECTHRMNDEGITYKLDSMRTREFHTVTRSENQLPSKSATIKKM